MKKIFTLITAIFFTAISFAANTADPVYKPLNYLAVNAPNDVNLIATINGRSFSVNDNNFLLKGIGSGTHTVKIVTVKRNKIFARQQVVFNKRVNFRNNASMVINVDNNGNVNVREMASPVYNNNRPVGNGNRSRDYDRDYGYEFERGYNKNSIYVYEDEYGVNRNNPDYGYYPSMTNAEFKVVVNNINKEWLESNKLKSALHVANNNKMSVTQLVQLLGIFSFESNRLDVAETAYKNVVDKEHFDDVYSLFSSNANKNKLRKIEKNYR